MQKINYHDLTNRNIGFISEAQQKKLSRSHVAVLGLGGLGGIVGEILVRCGIGYMTICDNDIFEPTNLNRQIFSFADTLGEKKTRVAERFFKKINPGVKVRSFNEITELNIGNILDHIDVVVFAIDDVKAAVITSRHARKHDIPFVDGWALPFGNVRVFTRDTPCLEETYHLSTGNKPLSSLSKQDIKALNLKVLEELTRINGIMDYFGSHAVERIINGEVPSFAPVVWLNAALMGIEVVKLILNWGKIAKAPPFALYDPFNHVIPEQNI